MCDVPNAEHERIVAADAPTPACVSQLLSITELSGVPVTAREPGDRSNSVGFLHGVDGDLTDSELPARLVSPVPVLASSKEGQTVRLRFACSQPPDRVTLCGLQLRVRHARPRALQCRQCRRFGHVSEACSLVGACIRCGRQHPAADSCSVRCVNCERGAFSRHVDLSSLAGGAESGHGPDPALETGGQGRSIREERREVRSNAAAVRANLPESPSKDPGLQRPTPAPRRSSLPTVSPSTTSPSHATPAEPAEDTRDALMASLLAALRAVRDALPADNPLRAVCLTALGGQPGSTQLN